MTVVLPGPAEIVWRGQEQNALRVVVTKADGWFAKVGFVDGDLVIGVDGTEFRNTAQMKAFFATIATKETVTLNLLRGGRRVDLTLGSKEFMESGGKGGRFDATTR